MQKNPQNFTSLIKKDFHITYFYLDEKKTRGFLQRFDNMYNKSKSQ